MSKSIITPVAATTLTPFHYMSTPIPSGAATLPGYIGDKAISFALGVAIGCFRSCPVLPIEEDSRNHMSQLPCLASMFETSEPSLMKPLGCRNNIDAELGFSKKIRSATSTGNLKTWYFIQEVPPEKTYKGAFFGDDPFELTGQDELVVRIGRHRTGIVSLKRDESISEVRLNAYTAVIFDKRVEDAGIKMEKHLLYNIQVTENLSLDRAANEIERWKN